MSKIQIRTAQTSDLPNIVRFLELNWKSDHVFVKDPDLLVWQHSDDGGNQINFVLAVDEEGRIFALQGFIPTARFDSDLASEKDLWLAIWKSIPHPNGVALGMQTQFFIERRLKPLFIGILGLSEDAMTIYRNLRYTTGTASQFYLLDADSKEFVLADPKATPPKRPSDVAFQASSLDQLSPVKIEGVFTEYNQTFCPGKSLKYLVERYSKHPYYQYQLEFVESANGTGIVVSRIVEHQGVTATRIVDLVFSGSLDWFAGYGYHLMKRNGSEYVDFYCAGLESLLNDSDWLLRKGDEVVIPNYYEPFEKKNVSLDFAYSTKKSQRVVFVKGDGDMDRPSLSKQ